MAPGLAKLVHLKWKTYYREVGEYLLAKQKKVPICLGKNSSWVALSPLKKFSEMKSWGKMHCVDWNFSLSLKWTVYLGGRINFLKLLNVGKIGPKLLFLFD